ncbi:XTP/dITP diphosphatase [Halanaerobacter jeridensis]|mgnify:CR=1 FL=1|uniref:dITP/XTP pyrophosphatase n=1 Tax=Halanaerobacter jeridensis TaxID=706427 RepID=A0A938XRM0_9FIRM|nr:XTP/dITP diphosphatase [Halanaerobacter jeridensis]MBM7556143.1 XTP/dITP diphosphohydrolase [Halanaerobacter jeridensis]
MKLFIATSNLNKVREMKEMLGDLDVEILSKEDVGELPEVEEDRGSFAGNALKKAKVIQQQVGLPTIADDSGLAVDALDGRPGVYSARFAGKNATDKENNRKLLGLLSGVEDNRRRAHFVCMMAFVDEAGSEEIVEGQCHGEIGFEPRGDNGFGYDPLFIPDGYRKTFAQLDSKVKNKISHRAQALEKMKKLLLDRGL